MQPRAMDPMPPRNSSPDSSRTAGSSGGGVDEGGSASAEGDGTSLPLFGARSGGGVVSFSTTGRKPTVGVGGIEGVVEAGIPVGAVTAVGLEEGFSSAVGWAVSVS